MLGKLLDITRIFGTAWHVNANEIMSRMAIVEGSGSPSGVVTPVFAGQHYQDTGTGDIYLAYGTTNTEWRRIALGGTGEIDLIVPPLGGKVGATAGWVITAGTNMGHATLPASQTASTLVLPVQGLEVGDVIIGWGVNGQAESAGGIATLTGDLRKLTPAAAANVDASISTDASGNMTADTVINQALVGASGLAEVVLEAVGYYLLLTGTTAAATDLDITNATVTVRR
jgi:hypothetical protein